MISEGLPMDYSILGALGKIADFVYVGHVVHDFLGSGGRVV